MFDIVKRTGLGMVLLMILPLLAWVSGWQWHPANEADWWRGMFWITQTVTAPWGILTSVILLGWFLWCLRFRLKPALGLACILGVTIVAGQGLKTIIKDHVQEPRPYVVWLGKSFSLDNKAFYALPPKERSLWVKKELVNDSQIPPWLRGHWQHDTGFAFPSGHTIFAASWALLSLGLLWPRRHVVSVFVIMVWAAAVMGSRLILGMHWPRDVLMGVFLSWLMITLACWVVQRFIGPLAPGPDKAQQIKSVDP